jgi:hypothetical protein
MGWWCCAVAPSLPLKQKIVGSNLRQDKGMFCLKFLRKFSFSNTYFLDKSVLVITVMHLLKIDFLRINNNDRAKEL